MTSPVAPMSISKFLMRIERSATTRSVIDVSHHQPQVAEADVPTGTSILSEVISVILSVSDMAARKLRVRSVLKREDEDTEDGGTCCLNSEEAWKSGAVKGWRVL